MNMDARRLVLDLLIVILIISFFVTIYINNIGLDGSVSVTFENETDVIEIDDFKYQVIQNLTFSSKKDIFNWAQSFESSGKIFRSGIVSHSISTGYLQPGTKIGVYVGSIFEEAYENISFKIYFVRIWPQPPEIVIEKEFKSSPFRVGYILPDEEDVMYAILVYAMENNEVVDILPSLVFVPLQKVNVKMLLDKDVYHVGDTLILTLVNEGPTEILFGYPYKLYRWNGTDWVEVVPPDRVFPLVGLILEPGKSWSQKIVLKSLEPGIYKIVKTVEGEGTNIRISLEATFTLES